MIPEIIPRWGRPGKISSDNGTPFVSAALRSVREYFGIDMRQHCAYHPASGGAIERENASLKNKLAKCREDMGLPEALPVVLMQMRSGVRAQNGFSPFKILFGRPLNMGVGHV